MAPFDGAGYGLPFNARMECGLCWYVYDPAFGVPEAHIAPYTPFSLLPASWCCPVCSSKKERFLHIGSSSQSKDFDVQEEPVRPFAFQRSSKGDLPAERFDALVAAYHVIRSTGMGSAPVANDRLMIESLGFRASGDDWIGLMITPWFIGMVLVSGDGRFDRARRGDKIKLALPAGTFEFIVEQPAAFGPVPICRLFAPVGEFSDQSSAREAALQTFRAVFEADGVIRPSGAGGSKDRSEAAG